MSLPVQLPKYHNKDSIVLISSMLPMAMLINFYLFKNNYFSSAGNFLLGTLSTFCYLGLAFITYGLVAVSLRARFPNDGELFKRMTICLSIFFLMSAVYMSVLLLAYDYFNFLGYRYYDNDFLQCYITFVILNVFLTFFNEGLYRFEKFKATATETEQLKKEYLHSQLLGLKSQMNPHFLFNGLNTLSSLIHEDAERAEEFLDQMSKVYRYLLRNNEEQLVSVATELNFIRSYYFLLKARHAEGLHLTIDVETSVLNQHIPPLTLQMIMENSIHSNAISRAHPLAIHITTENGWIQITNSVQPRIAAREEQAEVIDNIRNKFRLLCQQEIEVTVTEKFRRISLPLIPSPQIAEA